MQRSTSCGPRTASRCWQAHPAGDGSGSAISTSRGSSTARLAVVVSSTARELLGRLLEIERRLGRVPRAHGPRFGLGARSQLHLLITEDDTHRRAGPEVPHPRLAERRLTGLLALGPALELPGGGGPGLVCRATMTARCLTSTSRTSRGRRARPQEGVDLCALGLFRYCVLDQDVTYLCVKLDLQYVPQQSYLFFQLEYGGRLGLGQELPHQDHPARRGLHLERRDRRGSCAATATERR